MARILLIEDQPNNARLIRRFLEKAGHELHWASNGSDGLKESKALNPDLVIMDVGLPDMEGYTVLKLLRTDPGTQEIRVIILTARALPEDRKRAQEAGATDFMTKPIDFPLLQKRIHELTKH